VFKEFREFAMRGNVVDMAVGIIIGAAFGAIVTSLVNDLLMPPLGLIIGQIDASDFFLVLKEGLPPGPYASMEAARAAGAVTLNFGLFINKVVNFVIVAFAVFLLVKGVNSLKRRDAGKSAEAPAPREEVLLLTEIRDALVRK